jgi:hypothetical protein
VCVSRKLGQIQTKPAISQKSNHEISHGYSYKFYPYKLTPDFLRSGDVSIRISIGYSANINQMSIT